MCNKEKFIFKRKKAFSLVELMAVLAIITILFTAYNSSVRFAADKTRMSGVQTDFREFFTAVELIGSKHSLSEITTSEFERLLNEYLSPDCAFTAGISEHKDPWGNSYRYSINITDGVFSAAFASSGRKAQEEYFFNVASASETGAFVPRVVMYVSMDTSIITDEVNYNVKEALLENIKNLPNPIMGHPVTQSALDGHPVTFSVDTSAQIVTSYQWYENDTEIPGATSSSYTKTATLADNGNYYHCKVVVNGKEYFSDRARLDVYRLHAEQLQIMAYPNKLTYTVGSTFDPTGLSVKAYFNDGSDKIITDYTITNGSNLQKGTTEIVIVYDGVSCTVPVQVQESDTASAPIDIVLTADSLVQFGISTNGAVNVPELVTDGNLWYKVVGIADSAFANSTVSSITLPEGVTSVGNSAFYGCNSLSVINLPSTVTMIGDSAFAECGQLTINYAGSAAEWDAITKGGSWSSNTTVTLRVK